MRKAEGSLHQALALQHEAAQDGFDWSQLADVWAKLEEELAELREAIPQGETRTRDEFGDLLFVTVNLARHLGVDPEQALTQANAKFQRRYARVLAGRAIWDGLRGAARLEAMEQLWVQAKRDGL